jgi:hypothetical protein
MVAQCYLYVLRLVSLVGTSCGTFLGDILTGQVSAVDVASVLVGIVTGFPSAITLFSILYSQSPKDERARKAPEASFFSARFPKQAGAGHPGF